MICLGAPNSALKLNCANIVHSKLILMTNINFLNQQNISKLFCVCVSIKTLKIAARFEIIAIFTVLKNVIHCYICLAFRQHFDSLRLHFRHGASLGLRRHSGVAQSSIPSTFLCVVRTLSSWSGAAQSWNHRAP